MAVNIFQKMPNIGRAPEGLYINSYYLYKSYTALSLFSLSSNIIIFWNFQDRSMRKVRTRPSTLQARHQPSSDDHDDNDDNDDDNDDNNFD